MTTKTDRFTGYDALRLIGLAIAVAYARAYVISLIPETAWYYGTTYGIATVASVLCWIMAALGIVCFVVDYKKKI